MTQTQILLDEETVAMLDKTAMATNHSREAALREAIQHYVDYDQYARVKIAKGLQDIDEGRIYTADEVDRKAEVRIAEIMRMQSGQSE